MFHTFDTGSARGGSSSGGNNSKAKRRTSTVRACEPCRRRKIRCNGEQPCETCTWYRKAETCHYTEPRQRQVPYQRSIEKISSTLQDYRAILQKLFPNTHPERLLNVPRERLVELITQTSPSSISLSPSISQATESRATPPNPEAGSLEALQTLPEENSDTTESKSNGVPGISDDVNGLSLSVKQASSYQGISSVMAVLRVIIWLDPEAQASFARTPDRSAVASRNHTPPADGVSIGTPASAGLSSVWDEIPLINAYFVYVHTLVPLIEEQSFRETYTSGRRHDSRWLALLNTVLAMGSVAASTSDDVGHRVYFNRAKQHLALESLGSAHLETVQTLALLGGFYLHYIQQPNLANAIMGATFRLATTLGLHREYMDGQNAGSPKHQGLPADMRRRVWWCTFNLDAWASLNLGRPSMGRWGHAIGALPPQLIEDTQAGPILLLKENIKFCVITTRIEDALAVSPLIPPDELLSLDNSLLDWCRNLPPALQVSQTTPQQHNYEMPGMTIAKCVMRWRFHLARIAIHRPVLLWYALRRMPLAGISAEKQQAIEKCRDAASELIADVSASWKGSKTCQMSGWNATWIIYQASMVPMLSLFSDAVDAAVVEKCRHQVEVVMAALAELRGWSQTASRSLEVMGKIYDASKKFTIRSMQSQGEDQSTPSQFYDPVHNTRSYYQDQNFNVAPQQTDLMVDTMWDSLNWSTGFENMAYPFDTSPEWEYGPATGWTDPTGAGSFPFDMTYPSGSAQMMNQNPNGQQPYQQNQ